MDHLELYKKLRKATPEEAREVLERADSYELHQLRMLGQDHISDEVWAKVHQEATIRRIVYTSVDEGRREAKRCDDITVLRRALWRAQWTRPARARKGLLTAIERRMWALRTHAASTSEQPREESHA